MRIKTVSPLLGCWIICLLLTRSAAIEPESGTQPVNGSAIDRRVYPSDVLSALQKSHAVDSSTFINQGELDFLIPADGGGACAAAAGIDVYQALRVMFGLDQAPNPHKLALLAFANQPELLKGRVPNGRFVKLIEFYRVQLAHLAS